MDYNSCNKVIIYKTAQKAKITFRGKVVSQIIKTKLTIGHICDVT
jgi:hypothetical protein